MIKLTIEQAQQIEEALELAIRTSYSVYYDIKFEASLAAIRAARAHDQAEQRPQNCGTGYCSCIECPYEAEQAEQEPVAYVFKVKRTLPSSTPLDVFAAIEYHPLPHEDIISKEPLYAAPVRTKDLTDDEIAAVLDYGMATPKELEDARAVIAADREKNK